MDFYPTEFSPEARDRIEREKLLAYRELLPNAAYRYIPEDEELVLRCIMRIFLAFAKEACQLRTSSGWTIERVETKGDEFRRRVTIMVVYDKAPEFVRFWISHMTGSVMPDIESRLKSSPEWREYEELLLVAAPRIDTNGTSAGKVYHTHHGRNIDELRIECGWSFDQLANKTGLDKKQVLSHVNKPTNPHLGTLKLYADAFTRELGRTVTVGDLQASSINPLKITPK